MKTVTNLVKALVLIGLIFGVLYFGIDYYFAVRKPAQVSLEKAQRPVVSELQALREQMAEFEQTISDLRRDHKPFDDEAEALEGIKEKISRLKKEVNAPDSLSPAAAPAAAGTQPVEGLFSDSYQMIFLAVIGFLLLLFLGLIVYGRLRKPAPAASPETARRTPPAPPPSAPPRVKPAPPSTDNKNVSAPPIAGLNNEQADRLRETMEKFRAAAAPVLRQAETRELEISGIKDAGPREPAPESAPPVSLRIGKAQVPAEPSKSQGNEVVDQVFELNGRGLSVPEISEKLHIDQDQVRLILRFKQP